jgi:allantoin racemase
MKIRVITPVTSRDVSCAEDFEALGERGWEISHSTLATGPESIESEFEVAFAMPGTVAAAVEAERDGVHAVVIDCMCDPALAAAREALSIPVLGAAQCAYHVAAILADRFSVLVVDEREIPMFENNARVYGVDSKLGSVRSIDIPVLDLAGQFEAVISALCEESLRAIERDRARAIVLGCTGMKRCPETLGQMLQERGCGNIPIVEPVRTAVQFAGALVELGLTQSKRTYPFPPAKRIVGYDVGLLRTPV